jgi:hypothetical protein
MPHRLHSAAGQFPVLAQQIEPDLPELWENISLNMDIVIVRTLKLAAFEVVHQVRQCGDCFRDCRALRFRFVLQKADVIHCFAFPLP